MRILLGGQHSEYSDYQIDAPESGSQKALEGQRVRTAWGIR